MHIYAAWTLSGKKTDCTLNVFEGEDEFEGKSAQSKFSFTDSLHETRFLQIKLKAQITIHHNLTKQFLSQFEVPFLSLIRIRRNWLWRHKLCPNFVKAFFSILNKTNEVSSLRWQRIQESSHARSRDFLPKHTEQVYKESISQEKEEKVPSNQTKGKKQWSNEAKKQREEWSSR